MIELPNDVIRCVVSAMDSVDVFMLEKTCKEMHDHVGTVVVSQKKRYEMQPVTFNKVVLLAWFHGNNRDDVTSRITTQAMDYAARYGHLEVVKWLHANRREGCTVHAMDYAAQHGHLELVEWLHHNRTEGWSSGYARTG
jgi:tRNA (Thr-GGU) A37 N-methylase